MRAIELDAREYIEQLEASEGWQRVKSYIDRQIDHHTNQLLSCELEKVLLHRAAIRELSLIYTHMEELKNPTE